MLEWIAIAADIMLTVPRAEWRAEWRNIVKRRFDHGSPMPTDVEVVKQIAIVVVIAIASAIAWSRLA